MPTEDFSPIPLPVSMPVRAKWEQWKVVRQRGLRRLLRLGRPTLTLAIDGVTVHGAGMDSEIRIPAETLRFVKVDRAMPLSWAAVEFVDRHGECLSMMVFQWRRLVGALVTLGFTVFENPAWPNMLGVARARGDVHWQP